MSVFDSKRPLYQKVAEKLIEKIQSKELSIGDLLPSEAQLCLEYDVSRHTVREAIRALAGFGMIAAQAGIGTRVIAKKAGNYVQSLKEISDLNAYVTDTKRQILKTEILTPKTASLNLPGKQTDRWHMLESLRLVHDSDTIVAWTQVYVLSQYGSVFKQATDNILVYSLIEENFDIRTTRLRQSITAIAAPASVADLLKMPRGAPALGILREYSDQNGQIYEVSWSIHPPDRYQNNMELVLSLNGAS